MLIRSRMRLSRRVRHATSVLSSLLLLVGALGGLVPVTVAAADTIVYSYVVFNSMVSSNCSRQTATSPVDKQEYNWEECYPAPSAQLFALDPACTTTPYCADHTFDDGICYYSLTTSDGRTSVGPVTLGEFQINRGTVKSSPRGEYNQLTSAYYQTVLSAGVPPPGMVFATAVDISCPNLSVSDGKTRRYLSFDRNGFEIPRVAACDAAAPDSPECEKAKANNVDCSVKVNDPVDVASGAYYFDRMLLSMPSTVPMDFEIAYSSLLPADLGIGFGWSHRFGMRLAERADNSVAIHWPNGRITRYRPTGAGAYDTTLGDAIDVLVKNADGTFDLTDMLQRRYHFLATGELQTETRNVQGLAVALNYNWTGGKLQSVSDPVAGKQLTFTWNSAGRLATVSSVEDGTTTATAALAYDANGNLVKLTDARGKATQFSYDSAHRLLTSVNELGQTTLTNDYDSSGRVSTQRDFFSATSALAYGKDADGNYVTSYLDRTGQYRYFTYDTQLRLVKYKDALGNVTVYSYDAAGNRISSTDAANRKTVYQYDARGNLTGIVDPLNRKSSFTWNSADQVTSVTNPLGETVSYQYAGQALQQLTDPLGRNTSFGSSITYQPGTTLETSITLPRSGIVLARRNPEQTAGSFTDATGRVVTWTYDPATRTRTAAFASAPAEKQVTTFDPYGRLLSYTDALGHATTLGYDDRGRPLTVTDPRGGVTTFTYNENDRVVGERNALNELTTFTYDAEDRIKTINDTVGVHKLTYDETGRPTKIDSASLQTEEIAYTVTGAVATRSTGATKLTYAYDSLDRQTQVSNALGQSFSSTYDAAGRPKTLIDALGRQTTLSYDAAGQLVSVADPALGVASQSFDADGNQTTLKDPKGQITTFSYDLMGRPVASTTPDGSTVALAYDGKGQLATFTNGRGQVTTYSYDAAGRLVRLTDPAGSVAYTYDANGNQLTATDGVGTITRVYDALNRVTSFTDVYGNQIQYEYDTAGNLTKITYPGAKAVAYTYDNASRLKTVVDWASRGASYGYDNSGRPISVSNTNGKNVTLEYDVTGRLTSYNDGVTTTTYQFDANGKAIQESSAGLARPTTAPTFTYDSANRLSSVNGQAVTHDADGNLLNIWNGTGLQTATYDARNRLTQLGNTTFVYDAEDRRVAQVIGGVVTRYVVDPRDALSQILMETDGNNTPTAYYIYGRGLLMRRDAAGNYAIYHHDRRGSVTALTNTSGVVTDSYQYGPFGELVAHTGSNPQPFRFNGRDGVVSDPGGLHYLRARYYSPNLKRFVQRDVITGTAVLTPSLNRYAYVNGQPIDLVDPFGLKPIDWDDIRRDYIERLNEAGEPFFAAYVGFAERDEYLSASGDLALGVIGAADVINPFYYLKHAISAAAGPLAEQGIGSCYLNRRIADAANLVVSLLTIRYSLRKANEIAAKGGRQAKRFAERVIRNPVRTHRQAKSGAYRKGGEYVFRELRHVGKDGFDFGKDTGKALENAFDKHPEKHPPRPSSTTQVELGGLN